MRRFLPAIGIFYFINIAAAQEFSLGNMLPGIRERAVVIDIVARVVEHDSDAAQREVWNSVSSKITIPGRPVTLRLVGSNIVIAVQFTPYFPRNGNNVLVAQGQIWMNVPDQGIRYQTTLQTIPLEFGESIYFFPLGSEPSENGVRIEIQIQLNRYAGPPLDGERRRDRGNMHITEEDIPLENAEDG